MTRRLAQVAKKVGVSEATVSRVLNGRPGVSEATRQSVLTALDVLGYERPTQLRGERARLVGLVIPELQNPIFPALAEVIGGALAQRGLTPVLCTQTKGGAAEADYVDLLLQQQVSGVVFAGGFFAQGDAPHGHYQLLAERKIPVVLINAMAEGLDFPCVACDDIVAVEQAWRHLASLGHRRIGLVLGPRDHAPSRRKLDSAQAMARAAGTELTDEFVERSIFSLEGGQAAGDASAGARGHRHRVRQRPARPGGDPGGAPTRAQCPTRRVGRRLRRLLVHELHGPAPVDGAAAHRSDGARGSRPAVRPDPGRRPQPPGRAPLRAGTRRARLDRAAAWAADAAGISSYGHVGVRRTRPGGWAMRCRQRRGTAGLASWSRALPR